MQAFAQKREQKTPVWVRHSCLTPSILLLWLISLEPDAADEATSAT